MDLYCGCGVAMVSFSLLVGLFGGGGGVITSYIPYHMLKATVLAGVGWGRCVE